MTMSRSPSNRRRPKRQRTPTTLYTDDNPSTFTTKVPKSERVGPEVKPPKPSFYFVEEDDDDDDDDVVVPTSTTHNLEDLVLESPTGKRPYRKRKPYHKDDMLETTTAERLEAMTQERNATPPPPVKRKRGRPPKNKNPPPPIVTNHEALTAELAAVRRTPPTGTSSPAAAARPPKTSPVPASNVVNTNNNNTTTNKNNKSNNKTPTPKQTWTPAAKDLEGTYLNHALKVAPILPPEIETDASTDTTAASASTKLATTTPVNVAPLETPNWSPLYQPDVYFDDDYGTDSQLPEDLLPVTRSITCMTTRKPDHAYLAVGDSAGFCIIYTLQNIIRPVARLETVACQQRAKEQQDKIRDQQRRKRKSLVMDTSQTTIHAMGMIANRVVLATALELECMDIPSQTSLWVCPLSQDRLVTSLDMHPQRYDVLVSCSLFDHAEAIGHTSPLMLLQHSQNNIEVCDANAPILLRSPCCTAIWDSSKNSQGRLLFVVVAGEDLELVLVQGGSIDSWKVARKTRIPVKQSNHNTRLAQSQEGNYTLVASSRGIRLYQTETLQLIHVYGDQLALHGKSIAWNDCLLLGKRLTKQFFQTSKGNFECHDWIQATQDNTTKDKEQHSDDLGQYVIGVPSYKGAKELTETLHVWRVEHASVVPALSIPLPPKTEGVQALVVAPSPHGGDRLILAGRDGEGHVLVPKKKSDFAGIMYPPGYQVLTDNVEFVEDEAELDTMVPKTNETITTEEEMDDDLREAMRRSLLEQEEQETQDEDVDILNNTTTDEEEPIIPCRPEPYLKHAVNAHPEAEEEEAAEQAVAETSPEGPASPNKVVKHDPKAFVSDILESLGHTNPKKKEGGGDFSFSVTAKVVIAPTRPGGGRRTKNLETMLKASIDPRLQRYMISKQALGASGKGSRLLPLRTMSSSSPSSSIFGQPTPATTSSTNGTSLSPGLTALGNGGRSNDEAAVALGLLGLSPTNSRGQTPDPAASDTASRTSSQRWEVESEVRLDPNCPACRGRLVIHACGKRSLPIDYDQVAKLEREKKEREEEEKKRLRAEKRRLADQRRREARKLKQRELEEQRRREAEDLRLEQERAMHDRRDRIMASYASHVSHNEDNRSTSMATADALVALASFAGQKAFQPEPAPAAHGFGGIPSFATLQQQQQPRAAPQPPAPPQEPRNGLTTFVWPPRSES